MTGVSAFVLRPVAVVLALPGMVVASVNTAARVARTADAAVAHLATLAGRAAALLTGVEPPVRRVATSLDAALVDDLVRSAREVPVLLAAAFDAVRRFDRFVAHAEGVRDMTDGLVRDVETLIRRTAVAVADIERVAARADATIGAATDTVRGVDVLAQRVAGVVDTADRVVGAVVGTLKTVDELAEQVRPVIELAAGVGRQVAEPADDLLPLLLAQAPQVAELTPALMEAVRDLIARLPELMRRLDEEVLPTLQKLSSTPGDVRALRDSVSEIEPLMEDVEAELAGLPGSRLLRRRGRKPEGDD